MAVSAVRALDPSLYGMGDIFWRLHFSQADPEMEAKDMRWRYCNRTGILVLGFLAVCRIDAGAAISRRGEARQILRDTGVQGGLIVHLGCGDGRLTAALGADDAYLVHGLDTEAANVDAAREHIRARGLYGRVAVEPWNGKRLPYNDNLINLLVAEGPVNVPTDEVLRVLAPNGVAYIRTGGQWTKTVKPRPKEIDEWTHYFHDADGNAVARDTVVGPPRRMQWVGSPRWARHHDHMASMSALVSANGRIFYIIDEGSKASIQLPAKWFLYARDAFNGTVLWKRPIPLWNTHLWPLKSGPAQLPRRLVAVGDTVYVTLGLDAPVTALDAATGEILRTYKDSRGTEELIASGGVLFLQVSDAPTTRNLYRLRHTYVWDNTREANRGWAWDKHMRRIVAVRADTGKLLFTHVSPVTPMTLAANAKQLFFHDGERIVCLNRKDGSELWHSDPVKTRSPVLTSFGPRLIVYEDVVLFAGGAAPKTVMGFSADTGKTLWTAKHARSGHQSPEDLLVVGGLVWSGAIAGGKDSGVFTGLDPHTGEVKKQFPPDVEIYWFHHRCHTSKATDRYLLTSRTGIEFVDVKAETWTTNHWVRGGCIYGIMPCNGLVYVPPHACACYLESKLYGFSALAPAAASPGRRGPADSAAGPDETRLQRGPAYSDRIQNPKSGIQNRTDWPTYRHDPARSGFTNDTVPADLKRAWRTTLGGRLSSVVVAGDRLYVASIDTHTVYALDASSGDIAWRYTAGGRVDSPPTVYQGRVLFGAADGWVYCLRASDGALAWRFRAAPEDRRLVAFEQVESVWPVHGSVLVQDGVACCVAGRSMFLDGGLRLVRLDPATGHKLSESVLDDRDPESGKNLQIHVKNLTMPVALPDVLSCDGRYLYMRSQRFDLTGVRQDIAPRDVADQVGEGVHLFAVNGFLDDARFHRGYWMYGRTVTSGWGGWFRAGRFVPSGRPLVVDGSRVYGYARKPEYLCQSSVLEYHLFAADKEIQPESIQRVQAAEKQMNATTTKRNAHAADWKVRKDFPLDARSASDYKWRMPDPPLQALAMVLANNTLFVAGPPDVVDEEEAFYNPDAARIRRSLAKQRAALDGLQGALLWAVSAKDGKTLTEYRLKSPPVWDGMAAANGRLFLATQDGKVLCLAGRSGE